MDKCKSDPKLFYKHINGTNKNWEGITTLAVDIKEQTKAKSMPEATNERFQSVFTTEEEFSMQEGHSEESNLIVELKQRGYEFNTESGCK